MPYGFSDTDWAALPQGTKDSLTAYYTGDDSQFVSGGAALGDTSGDVASAPATTTTTGSGGTSSKTSTNLPENDWVSTFFASLGLPSDLTSNVNKIFTQYSDVNSASAAALGYIRGTPWYSQTYPGIQDAMSKGVVSNEADYRDLLNRQNQVYRQYLGRDISSDEYKANLGEGVNLGTIGGRLQGSAYANTYGNDWRYTLGAYGDAPNDSEVQALGQEKAGLDSPLGIQIQQRLQLAQQRLAGVFQGSLASPSLSLSGGRLSAPSLNTFAKQNIGASSGL